MSYQRHEQIVFADRERRAANKPSWYYVAKSAVPEVYDAAQRRYTEQYRLEANDEQKTTVTEKWTVVDTELRESMAEEMTALDALTSHVKTWTECDPVTVQNLLKGATTEQERMRIILGSHIKLPIKKPQGMFHGPEKSQIAYKTYYSDCATRVGRFRI